MAFTFDATVGGVAANSWATVAEADDYFAGRLGASAWTAKTTLEKQVLLASGTAALERYAYRGTRATDTQRLRWPRAGLIVDGVAVPVDAIPRELKEALFEYVMWRMSLGTADPTLPTGLEPFSRIEIPGAVSISMRDPVTGVNALPPQVLALLAWYLAVVTAKAVIMRLVRT